MSIAGDIADDDFTFVTFCEFIAEKYKQVYIIFGNHDLTVRGSFGDVDGFMKWKTTEDKLDYIQIALLAYPNVHLLDGNVVDGFGGTIATPNGILELLKRYNIETKGKKCVVLGRSNIVGKPMAALLMQKAYPGDCTVTVCHSHTANIKEECLNADIIVAALGQPEFVTADMVKPGAVIIDVGTTRVPDATRKSGFKLTGDVKFDEVAPKCSFITPVPGGVGPMTICSLMKNTLLAGQKVIYK